MIAPLRTELTEQRIDHTNQPFQALLPQIRRQAGLALRHLRAEARDEALAEVVARAFCTWRRLVEQGRAELARPTPLVKYAVRQVSAGRRVGCRMNVNDILSAHSRRTHGIKIERLDRRDPQTRTWDALLVEDRKAGPAATAAARLDHRAWLRLLSKRNRAIACALALGEATGAVAQQFGLSAGRISQLRAWLRQHWEQFQSEAEVVVSGA